MVTKEMLSYIGVFSKTQIKQGLRKHYALDSTMLMRLKGCTKTILVLHLIGVIIDENLNFEQLVKILK